jgi:hypothetical protein
VRGALALLAVAALVALPGCGSSKKKEIPRADADRMIALIRLADQEAQAGTCGGAAAKAREAGDAAASLPRSVDRDLRQGIADGITRLEDLIAAQCQKPQTPTNTTPTQSQTTTSQTTTSETTTTPSTTTPTTTTPSTTTPTTTTPTGTSTGTSTTGSTTTDNGGTPPPPSGIVGQ